MAMAPVTALWRNTFMNAPTVRPPPSSAHTAKVAGPLDHGAFLEREQGPGLLLSQEDVLVDEQVVEEVQLLVHVGDARVDGGLDRGLHGVAHGLDHDAGISEVSPDRMSSTSEIYFSAESAVCSSAV